MLGLASPPRRPPKGEAEKPFWISYADMMTALMVLFLVVMAVALLVVTQALRDNSQKANNRENQIKACMDSIKGIVKPGDRVTIKDKERIIDFGSRATFEKDRHELTAEQQEFLRNFIPKVLAVARVDDCSAWLKQVVVDGFASQTGSYIHNLNLSLQRSERVLCTLLDPLAPNPLDNEERKFIREKFLVGGSSFNSFKTTAQDSQRIELRVEFKELGEASKPPPTLPFDNDPKCPLDP